MGIPQTREEGGWLEEEKAEAAWPGVTEWFTQRREADQEREKTALRVYSEAPHMTAVDIPVAGVDWPYGRPVDVDHLRRLEAEHGIGQDDYRLWATPDPPGTLLRIRMRDERRRELSQFARQLCEICRAAEDEARVNSRGQPFGAQCARFAARLTNTRWMSAYAPAGLTPVAPPDAVATALASYTASLVVSLPRYHPVTWPGDRKRDIVLPKEFDGRVARGRRCLDALMDILEPDGIPAQLAVVGPAPPSSNTVPETMAEVQEVHLRWRVIGFGDDDGTREALKREIGRILQRTGPTGTEVEAPDPPPKPDDEGYLARVGLGILNTLGSIAPQSPPDEAARLFSIEHGTTSGHDRRILMHSVHVDRRTDEESWDQRLALERLSHIQGDPCRAGRVREQLDLAKREEVRDFKEVEP